MSLKCYHPLTECGFFCVSSFGSFSLLPDQKVKLLMYLIDLTPSISLIKSPFFHSVFSCFISCVLSFPLSLSLFTNNNSFWSASIWRIKLFHCLQVGQIWVKGKHSDLYEVIIFWQRWKLSLSLSWKTKRAHWLFPLANMSFSSFLYESPAVITLSALYTTITTMYHVPHISLWI